MDSHFEVILERVKQLTEKSGTTVWFELPEETVKTSQIMVLINEHNKIGVINVKYKNKVSKLTAFKLTKTQYDTLAENRFKLTCLDEYNIKPIDTSKLVKWIV